MSDLPRLAILAEGQLDFENAKTAAGVLRYAPGRVEAVLDSTRAGRTTDQVLGIGGDTPVVAGLDDLPPGADPEALLIGIAPVGGGLPEAWRPVLRGAIRRGLDVWSGLHVTLAEDPELSALAAGHGVELRDLRAVPDGLPVAAGRARETDAFRVLTVGSDCATGKMTAALEIRRELEARGLSCGFGATGQTGIALEGSGIAVDAVKSDFVAGAAERLTLEAAAGRDLVLVEGQGSIFHPGYSAVTLGLMHGAMPEAMVLTWMPSRPRIHGEDYAWTELPPLDAIAAAYEEAMAWARPDPEAAEGPLPGVVAVACTTYEMEEDEALRAVERARELTGLPAADPVRQGAGPLADAVEEAMAGRRES